MALCLLSISRDLRYGRQRHCLELLEGIFRWGEFRIRNWHSYRGFRSIAVPRGMSGIYHVRGKYKECALHKTRKRDP